MSELRLPEIKKLSELFSEIVPYTPKLETCWQYSHETHLTEGERVYAASFSFPEYKSFKVTPTRKVNEVVSNMNNIVSDPNIYFEFVVRDDKTLLVIAKYNKILGSCWLTIIEDKEEINKLINL